MTSSGEGIRLASESIAGRRPYQEDSVDAVTLDDGRIVVAVADGMGGHAAGELASALALEALLEGLSRGEALDASVRLANERVHAVAQDPAKKGMGTTLVVLLVDGDRYWIANVGDSRAYLLSPGGVEQVTRDHSFVAEAVARGTSEKEALESPWKDALTRSIGTEASVDVDLFGPRERREGSALLLCSDGLYKALSDSDVEEIFRSSGSPRGAAQALVAAALEGGSDDNITVAIAEFGDLPREQPGGTQELEWDPPEELNGESSRETEVDSTASTHHSVRGSRLWIPVVLALAGVALLVGLLVWI